ncbi:beta-glucuronidase [Aspergillus costaricaensis CBS 115574]|uniref:Beta-glucuronidase n=1 Tax=Aspergillus costaricaensis CBS 115574 TaxID=1448317 RepID=A0ACD1I8E2_9EURO|nr:beta-glucuronidase [Aspergillus costaricaensis CBS 115574]RAK86834.1 beta-glucuronidase [Aspergillus costaricaensis CBS 115574]
MHHRPITLLSLLLGAAHSIAARPTFPDDERSSSSSISLSASVPDDAALPVLHPFVSFSIEFAFFPDFAGNLSHPNLFSNHLLDNLAKLQGAKPYIRVGGNTQDFALYDPNLRAATNATYITSISTDYPLILSFGPAFFESYFTWPDTKFIHGFNLGKNSSTDIELMLESVPVACKALEGGKLAYWELGNEPDLYKTSAQGIRRPANWTEQDYVNEWLNKTARIEKRLVKACPELADSKYIAPSFAGVTNSLNPVVTWEKGLDNSRNIALNSEHNYIGGATQPGVTLQNTLMNHTKTVESVAQQVNVSRILSNDNLTLGIPYILGETNSLYNQGAPGLSNSFGAALWGVDFNLYCASQNIRRTHMHQGSNYNYISWQPVGTNRTSIGTKAPYYGNAMVAAMLHGGDDVRIVNLPLAADTEAAYAAYVNDSLVRVAVINLVEFNYTSTDSIAEKVESRPSAKYTFQLPSSGSVYSDSVSVQRLMANGSNAITGITWDGWSYNYELAQGKPVRLQNVTIGEAISVGDDGVVEIEIPYSSAAILSL